MHASQCWTPAPFAYCVPDYGGLILPLLIHFGLENDSRRLPVEQLDQVLLPPTNDTVQRSLSIAVRFNSVADSVMAKNSNYASHRRQRLSSLPVNICSRFYHVLHHFHLSHTCRQVEGSGLPVPLKHILQADILCHEIVPNLNRRTEKFRLPIGGL